MAGQLLIDTFGARGDRRNPVPGPFSVGRMGGDLLTFSPRHKSVVQCNTDKREDAYGPPDVYVGRAPTH
jgi:hypothetical protein